MAKRKMGWTEEKVKRYVREGRGYGELSEYKPWLTTQSFSTSGNSPRWHGWKTNRMHEYFSDLEKYYFFILEWADEVLDIREQYPILDREKTYEIAEQLDVNHPKDKGNNTLIPLTTDFLITVLSNGEKNYIARQIKPSKQLEDPRVIQKFEIELEYWKQTGVNWGIVTEKDIPMTFAKNIMNVHKYYHLENQEQVMDTNRILRYLIDNQSRDWTLIEFTDHFDESHNFSVGTSLNYIRHLIATKKISIDMYKKFSPGSTLLSDITISNEVLYKGGMNGFIS